MSIQAKCPNPACGKVLTVKDEHAGKKGKCPACGGAVRIPGKIAARNSPAAPAKSTSSVVAAEQATGTQDREEPAVKRPKKVESNLAGILLFCAGICLILLAAFAPLFTWVSLTVGITERQIARIAVGGMGAMAGKTEKKAVAMTDELSASRRPEGRLILTLCLVAAVLLAVGFALALSGVLQQKRSEQVLNGTLMLGLGWGIVLLVWSLAWFWKIVTLSRTPQSGLDDVDFVYATELTYQPFPGTGLFLFLFAALFSAYLFSQVANRLNIQRKQMFVAEQLKGMNRQAVERLYMGRKQLLVAEVAGIVLGGLLLLLVVEPWNIDELWKGIHPLALDLARAELKAGQ